jgi:hypothetical protein
MKKHGKKYRAALEKIEPGRKYNLEERSLKSKRSRSQSLTKQLS